MESSIEASQTEGAPKPKLAPKPLLTPKPFSLQQNTTIRSIYAPKSVTATSRATTHQSGKSEAPGVPKATLTTPAKKPPQQPATSDSNLSSESVHTKDQPKTTEEKKTCPHGEDTLDSSVAPGKSDPALQSAPPKETSESEPIQKEDVTQTNHNTSTDVVSNSEQKGKKNKEDETQMPVVQKLEESGGNDSSTANPKNRWGSSRNRLSMELTSKFESGGLSLPPQPTITISTTTSKDDANQPVPPDPEQSLTTSEPPNRESDEGKLKEEYSGGGSIKRRISLLFDSSSRPEVIAKREEPEIMNGAGGVKERIKNWTVEMGSECPKNEKKPQVVPRIRPKSFDPVTAPAAEKTPKRPPVELPVTGTSSTEAVDPPSKISPAEQPLEGPLDTSKDAPPEVKSSETSPATSGEREKSKSTEGDVQLLARSPPATHTVTDEESSAASESALHATKGDNTRRRSVHFGMVERDDGGPPVLLCPEIESNTEDEAPEDEKDLPVSVPAYRGVGILQNKDDEVQRQEEERLKHLEFEKRRKAEESLKEKERLMLEEEKKQKEEEEEKAMQMKEEEKRREEEKEREKLKEEAKERQRKEELERERLKEEERESERLREEEMERERQMELMWQRQREEERERAKQKEEILKQDQEDREEERLKEEERKEERLREERERQRPREEEKLIDDNEEHRLEEKLREEEVIIQEKQREEDLEKEGLNKTEELRRREDEERKKEEELELMWQRQKEEDGERARQKEEILRQEEREKERLREEEKQKEEERMKERQREVEEEERKRRELERKSQQEKEEMEKMRQIEMERQREEERRRQIEKERAEEPERKWQDELEELERKRAEELKEKLRMEREGEELMLTNLRKEEDGELEMSVDEPEPNLISFDSEPQTPSGQTYEPTESPIEVVYDDFSIKKPQLEVDFDDFSVKPKRWGSQAKVETSHVQTTSLYSQDENVEMLVPLEVETQERNVPEQVEKPDSPEPTPAQENSEKEEEEEEEEKEKEMEKEEEVETKEDEGEEDDKQETQLNSYHTGGEDKDTDALIDGEPDQQNGVCEPTSESDSPKPDTDQLPEVSPEDVDISDFQREPELSPFPESTTPLLDTSAQRSKADLGKRRIRTRPSRILHAGLTQTDSQDWKFRDSTVEKEISSKGRESDTDEEQPKPKIVCSPPPTSQRVPIFPGLNPAALIAQIKKRTGGGGTGGGEETEDKGRQEREIPNEELSPSPSQLSRSPRSAAHLAGAARVLPPIGGTDGGAISSPAWLKELKSKKRLSQHEGEA